MAKKQKRKFKCVSEKQKKAIKISYAVKQNESVELNGVDNHRSKFPKNFPFWARLKISKNRTTLVIDEEQAKDKKNNLVPGFVHREAIHVRDNDPKKLKNYERIFPNPDFDDKDPMYLKRPSKLPQVLFSPHNKQLNMPQHLIDKYDKNNKK